MDSQIPAYSDSLKWITAYLTVHSLSTPSWRYTFLLWLTIGFVSLIFAVLRWIGAGTSLIGVTWSKWSLRRRTWRKKHTLALAQTKNQPHRQPVSLPSNAQLLSVTTLILVSVTLALIGPDYLAPSLKVWQVQARSLSSHQLCDTSMFTSYMPQYTISKSFWSSSARAGQIAFALFPLCVLFVLKAPPFAVFAIPFMIELYFDKLAWLHRWSGRLIWFLTFIHVVLWSIQLTKDVNPSTGRVAYVYAWAYAPFIYGWIAFALLTLIILLSLRPIRRRFYEHFYILHIALVPCMLVMAGFHHPTVAWWCWASLLLWFGERLWRGIWWIYVNGVLDWAAVGSTSTGKLAQDAWETHGVHRYSVESTFLYPPANSRAPSPLHDHYLHDKGRSSVDHDTPVSLPHSAEQNFFRSTPYIPPCGYVHAELLSGRTVRLRLITPGFLPWSPGQHFLLHIPSVSRFASHPFTCASVCDEEESTDTGRMMVFLVRAKGGWTRNLRNTVSQLVAERSRGDVSPTFPSDDLPKTGVLLRAYVDGPFGSVKRTRWGKYSTAILISGGSGISFGLPLLQYMCMCLAGRDGRYLGGRSSGWGSANTKLKRIRFVWLVREYSHIQWCASVIRHCMSIVPSSALQVDIYVTNFKPTPFRHPPPLAPPRAHLNHEPIGFDEELEPPRPTFFQDPPHSRLDSDDSVDSHESDVDLNYYLGETSDGEPPADEIHIAHEENMLDLTNFEGEVDMALPEEAYLNRKVRKEGKLRRLRSRKLSAKGRLKQDVHPLSRGDGLGTQHAQDSRQTYPNSYTTTPQSSRQPQPGKIVTSTTRSADGLLATSLFADRRRSSSSETGLYTPLGSTPLPPDDPSTRLVLSSVTGNHEVHGDQESHSVPLSIVTQGVSGFRLPFEMDEQEAVDINIISEHMRPGKPKLDKVIADEVQASKGSVVVACCGPTSLNAIVRKIIAARIDPARIRRGDMRGSITLVSEDFEY